MEDALSKDDTGGATQPVIDGKQMHLATASGSLAPHCLLVGSPERAQHIAERYFTNREEVGNNRGLISFTGTVEGVPMSVVTHGMGGASMGIVLPEAVRSGARCFIRVGSCSTLWSQANVGDIAILTGAVRLDGASTNWAPIEYPAVADYRLVATLVDAATVAGTPHHVGIGATTSCFNEGQCRPDDSGFIPQRLRDQHEELIARGVVAYEMEAATGMVWASTHGGYWFGCVLAIYGNRITNDFRHHAGDTEAIETGIAAMLAIAGKYPLS